MGDGNIFEWQFLLAIFILFIVVIVLPIFVLVSVISSMIVYYEAKDNKKDKKFIKIYWLALLVLSIIIISSIYL
jgi:hypothetical protein